VRDYWSKHVSPHSPQLRLVETDAVKIEPYIIGRRSARSKLGVTADLDFTVIEIDDTKDRPLALIEMKTGPGSVESMREFQLDLNDYVDIASAVRGTGLPAYLVHVQVDTEIIPPTSRSVAVDMWWTDVLTLRQGFVRLAKRRDESKVAGYFSTSVFKAAALLATEFETHGYELLMEQLAGELPGLPA